MSNTPETDKAERMAFASEYMVPTEFARELERQRDEARKDAKQLSERLTALELQSTAELARLERERDEARNQRDSLRLAAQKEDIHHDRMIGELERVYSERDDAREVLQEIANASHFDNIGNWARNKARQALEELK